ncbi:putative glucan 1,3-beta-glucosidase D [Leucoagaricus sp. SymC.cos]|nr:putative glucan 1,3-beta-glucosidase D [Leucoagaricus sp. SymC.cos]
MASDPSRNIPYDPLPLTGEDQRSNALYNAPPSPDPHLTTFHTPEMRATDLGGPDAIPAGAAAPRFLGTALLDEPSLRPRESFASSYHTGNSQPTSEFNSSIYALNDQNTRFEGGYRDDPHDTYYGSDPNAVPMSPVGQSRMLEEKRAVYSSPATKSRRKIIILAVLTGLILIALAVVIPLYFAVIRPKPVGNSNSDHGSDNNSNQDQPNKPETRVVTGGDGSVITMEDGTKFTYRNPFGGYWYYDPEDPFNNGARAQSWSPALNETFNYGTNQIRGVNIGGWLVTEPFIVPALYEKYINTTTPAVDEWTLSQAMRADTSSGGIDQLEEHYKTFITEQDFAKIAGAGLNYVRIPIGFWAVEIRGNEPFLANTSWKYFLKAIQWARKYGIRINLDLHALPGSQNGWNHSGRLGSIGVLNGPMGYANAQRSLDIIRVLAEFISQPQYKDVVSMFGIVNEPQASSIGQRVLTSFYLEGYNIVRNAGDGTGEGKGPWVSIHDGFLPRDQWANVLPNADRLALDSHPYLCFNGQSDSPMSSYRNTPCTSWGATVNTSMGAFGLTTAGEFSNAVTDCGLWLNGVNLGTRYEGTYQGNWPRVGDCTPWTDWTQYNSQTKSDIKNFALSSMDALQNYFFWTWKIGNSSVTGKVESPAWSYRLGLEQGWMPDDPRDAAGACGNQSPWNPPLQAWQTGGAGAGNIPATVTSSYPWPPTTISDAGAVSLLPSYTPTGPIPTLPPPTLTAPSGSKSTPTADPGNGWNNPSDNVGLAVEIPGCQYLDPWVDPNTSPPPPCNPGGSGGTSPPVITPAPV